MWATKSIKFDLKTDEVINREEILMAAKSQLTKPQKNLTRRYLLWCYKTTKEDLDRIDRYFTQLKVDAFMLANLSKAKEFKGGKQDKAYQKKVGDFKKYMEGKESRVLAQKFKDPEKKILKPEYLYLQRRLAAIEKAIVHFLGKKELSVIEEMYEEEMTLRILEARAHT